MSDLKRYNRIPHLIISRRPSSMLLVLLLPAFLFLLVNHSAAQQADDLADPPANMRDDETDVSDDLPIMIEDDIKHAPPEGVLLFTSAESNVYEHKAQESENGIYEFSVGVSRICNSLSEKESESLSHYAATACSDGTI
jgi:hypothetical protein